MDIEIITTETNDCDEDDSPCEQPKHRKEHPHILRGDGRVNQELKPERHRAMETHLQQ
jgi:hypothetical protein